MTSQPKTRPIAWAEFNACIVGVDDDVGEDKLFDEALAKYWLARAAIQHYWAKETLAETYRDAPVPDRLSAEYADLLHDVEASAYRLAHTEPANFVQVQHLLNEAAILSAVRLMQVDAQIGLPTLAFEKVAADAIESICQRLIRAVIRECEQ